MQSRLVPRLCLLPSFNDIHFRCNNNHLLLPRLPSSNITPCAWSLLLQISQIGVSSTSAASFPCILQLNRISHLNTKSQKQLLSLARSQRWRQLLWHTLPCLLWYSRCRGPARSVLLDALFALQMVRIGSHFGHKVRASRSSVLTWESRLCLRSSRSNLLWSRT